MATDEEFRLPAPKFDDETKISLDSFTRGRNPHFSTPSGMLLPRDKQPPPMYGPRGSTVPPRFLNHQQQHNNRRGLGRGSSHHRFSGPPRAHFNNQGSGFERDVIPELLEVNWMLWCEGCDINCKTDEELRKHVTEHRCCDVEGCKYVGHPRVMMRHWRFVHDEKKLAEKAHMDTKQTPEEIEKWRLERKKRYPTKENVERRQRAQEERFKRGERIEEDKRRFPNRHQQEGGADTRRDFKKGGGQFRHDFKKPRGRRNVQTVETIDSDDDIEESRIAFKGTSQLKDYKEKAKTALSLLTGYGSDSDECSSEEAPESLSSVQDAQQSPEDKPEVSTPLKLVEQEDEAHLSEGEIVESECENVNPESIHISDEEINEEEELPTEPSAPDLAADPNEDKQPDGAEGPHTNAESKSKRRNRTRKRRNGTAQQEPSEHATHSKVIRIEKPLLDYSKLRYARHNTMLEKLLEPDIRHERNILLQCVRFVVENRFFGIGQPKQPATEQQNKETE